ncbi:T9SS type A sorting domain-containing protein [candidate division KSB1 bacterium]|nr:T9SS type A sorting domain-containing protein [candidate division KSB1 bacterium]
MTHRPEWTRQRNSFTIQEQTSFPAVNKITSTSFGDGTAFDKHTPLGFRVVQNVYEFKNSRFGLLHYEISLAENAEPLEGVYVGFWADIDAPDYPDRSSPANDKVGKVFNDKAAFIFDGETEATEIPLLGAMILGIEAPMVSYWKAGDDPNDDEQRYAYLQGNTPGTTGTGDYRILLSYGPFPLVAGETIQLSVVIVQAPELADFEDNLSDAAEFHGEELGFAALKKRAASLFPTRTSDNVLPRDFALHANFPNPFNPNTQIQFDLKEAVDVNLAIYNGNGQLVRTLVNGFFAAGAYTTTWEGLDNHGRQLPSGVYFYKMSAGVFQAQRKLLLLK